MELKEEKKLLNTLKSIDGTLKRIEKSLTHEAVKEAVSHALVEEKHNCASKDENYVMERKKIFGDFPTSVASFGDTPEKDWDEFERVLRGQKQGG